MTKTNGQDNETPENPNLIGQLTADEFAEVARLNHQRVSQERQIANLEIQKWKIMVQVGGVERALQQKMTEIGIRLNIPRDMAWDVCPDAEGNANARALTPEMMSQMVPSGPGAT